MHPKFIPVQNSALPDCADCTGFEPLLPAGLFCRMRSRLASFQKLNWPLRQQEDLCCYVLKSGEVFTEKGESFDVAAGTDSHASAADDGDYIRFITEEGLYFNAAATITARFIAERFPACLAIPPWTSTATGTYSYTFQVRATALRGGNALPIATDALNTQLIGMASVLKFIRAFPPETATACSC
jgi:hypothetical protein